MSIEIFHIEDFKLGSYPKIVLDENGKEKVHFQREENIGRMWLLYDEDTYLTEFNSYLLYMKRERGKSDSSLANAAQGLQKYLEFIKMKNAQLDALEKEHPYLPKEPRFAWNVFPAPLASRPTYAYKYFLEAKARDGKLETTNNTTRLYMNAVVAFYKWRLSLNENEFQHVPFNHRKVKVGSESGSSINESQIVVDSSDMCLSLPEDTDADTRRELYPMNDEEWKAVKAVLDGGYGIAYKNLDDGETKEPVRKAISKETDLIVRLSRYAGLRRQELVTFRLSCLRLLTPKQRKKLAEGKDGYILGVPLAPKDGVETKKGKRRLIEVPLSLMQELNEYVESERYLERLEKFKANNPDDPYDSPPVFISQRSDVYSGNTINCDWGRIRNMIRETYPELDFDHKFHNLRSTYATGRYLTVRELFNRTHGIEKSNSMALSYVGRCLGHKDHITTIKYLKYAEHVAHGNDIYEEFLSMTHGEAEQEMLAELDAIKESLKQEAEENEQTVDDELKAFKERQRNGV